MREESALWKPVKAKCMPHNDICVSPVAARHWGIE